MTPLQINIWSLLTDVSIGTWLGFVVTVVSSFGVLQVRRNRRKTKLRRSLLAELEQHDLERIVTAINAAEAAVPPDEKTKNPSFVPSELPPADTLPTEIYTSNAANLGILSGQEVEAVVEYYSSLLTQKAIIHNIRTNDDTVLADQKELSETVPQLEEARMNLLQMLKSKV